MRSYYARNQWWHCDCPQTYIHIQPYMHTTGVQGSKVIANVGHLNDHECKHMVWPCNTIPLSFSGLCGLSTMRSYYARNQWWHCDCPQRYIHSHTCTLLEIWLCVCVHDNGCNQTLTSSFYKLWSDGSCPASTSHLHPHREILPLQKLGDIIGDLTLRLLILWYPTSLPSGSFWT